MKIRLSEKCILLGRAVTVAMRARLAMFLFIATVLLDSPAITHTGVLLHPGHELLVLLVLLLGALAGLLFRRHGDDTFR